MKGNSAKVVRDLKLYNTPRMNTAEVLEFLAKLKDERKSLEKAYFQGKVSQRKFDGRFLEIQIQILQIKGYLRRLK